ncbi:zinc-binding dehydrogenase [Lacticaseibacillus thailandensis]|nr:zinc-binding dehydrogenase [Lacticaseibacillus thailandensis]
MKAFVVNHAGDSSALELVDRPMPHADATHSVMRIRAFGVHRYEVLTREGGSPSVHFPRVLGVEAVGEVAATAPDSGLKVGAHVLTINGGFGRAFDGSYEEYALVPNKQLYTADYQGSWTDFAQYPETFSTAYGALQSLRLAPHDHLLVRGGTSAVGLAIIKLAKASGYQVTATSRKAARLAFLRDAGADEAVQDRDGQLQTESMYAGIIDLVGATTVMNSVAHINVGGTCCMVGLLSGEWVMHEFSPFDLQNRYLTTYDSGFADQQLINAMFALINAHHITIPISKVFPFTDLPAAQDYVMANPQIGEVIVTTD